MDRKSLVTSIGSNLSRTTLSSAHEQESKLLDSSIDELFAKYTVPQLQKLQHGYQRDVEKAKTDLHHLVGGKYRDLIRIAEVIESMNLNSHQINTKLTDLSYKPAQYVSFGSNPHSKYDKYTRKLQAQLSRQSSQKTIINNIINNKLIGFDLLLQKDSLVSTAPLVHYAKVYHTIEAMFKEDFQRETHAAKHFKKLKDNFIAYIERKLSIFISTGETFQISGFLTDEEDLLHESADSPLSVENFKSSEKNIFEGDTDELSEDEYFNSLLKASTSAVVNFLAAYIIINNSNDDFANLSQIAERFVSLRLEFLSGLAKRCYDDHKAENLSFFQINQFAETTIACTEELILDIKSEVFNLLRANSVWNASDLIGFHGWFDSKNVELNSKISGEVDKKVSDIAFSGFSSFIELVIENISQNIKSIEGAPQSVNGHLLLLLEILESLQRIYSLCQSEERSCYVSNEIYTNELLKRITANIFEAVDERMRQEASSLNSGENAIVKEIISFLASGKVPNLKESDPFSFEVVNLIDLDLDKYLHHFDNMSWNSADKNSSNPLALLRNWEVSAKKLLNIFIESDETIMNKLEQTSLRAPHEKAFLNQDSILSRSRELLANLQKDIKTEIGDFISLILPTIKMLQDDKETIIQSVSLIAQLNECLTIADDGSQSILKQIDEVMCMLIEKLLQFTFLQKPSLSLRSYEEELIDSLCPLQNKIMEESSQAPSLRLQSLMYGLSQEFLRSSSTIEHTLRELYRNSLISVHFKSSKNLIFEKIIQKAIEKLPYRELLEKKKPHTEKASNAADGSNKKSKKKLKKNKNAVDNTESSKTETQQHAEVEESESRDTTAAHGEEKKAREDLGLSRLLSIRQFLSNIAFLQSIMSCSTLEVDDSKFGSYIEIFNIVLDDGIDSNEAGMFVRSANEFFKSHRNIFLPLLG